MLRYPFWHQKHESHILFSLYFSFWKIQPKTAVMNAENMIVGESSGWKCLAAFLGGWLLGGLVVGSAMLDRHRTERDPKQLGMLKQNVEPP